MERLANNISQYLQRELSLDNKNYQVVNYGMIALVQILAFVIILLFTGLLFDTLLEGYILTFIVAILRKSSGGVHASSLEVCTAIGVIASIVLTLIAKYILSVYLTINQAVILTSIIYIYCFIVAFKLVPVDNPNKPISSEDKKKRLRKKSFITLTVSLCISIILILLNNKFYISCSFCISLASLWQIFSLTKPGALLFHSFDNCLMIIINKLHNRRTV